MDGPFQGWNMHGPCKVAKAMGCGIVHEAGRLSGTVTMQHPQYELHGNAMEG